MWKRKELKKAIRKTDRTQCFLIPLQNPEALFIRAFFLYGNMLNFLSGSNNLY